MGYFLTNHAQVLVSRYRYANDNGTNRISGNSPADIENLITRPLEKEIKSVKGLKKLTSTSVQDNSSVIVEFNTDIELKVALQDVKDAVDKAKSDLPSDLDMDPMVMDIDFSEFPILTSTFQEILV